MEASDPVDPLADLAAPDPLGGEQGDGLNGYNPSDGELPPGAEPMADPEDLPDAGEPLPEEEDSSPDLGEPILDPSPPEPAAAAEDEPFTTTPMDIAPPAGEPPIDPLALPPADTEGLAPEPTPIPEPEPVSPESPGVREPEGVSEVETPVETPPPPAPEPAPKKPKSVKQTGRKDILQPRHEDDLFILGLPERASSTRNRNYILLEKVMVEGSEMWKRVGQAVGRNQDVARERAYKALCHMRGSRDPITLLPVAERMYDPIETKARQDADGLQIERAEDE